MEPMQVTAAVEADLTQKALDLLSAEVMEVAGLTLLGMALGMFCVGFVRVFFDDLSHAVLKKLGAGSSALWTLIVVSVYLWGHVGLPMWVAVAVAILPALAAGACNHPLFRPVKAVWKLARKLLADWIRKNGGDDSDLHETQQIAPPKTRRKK